MWRTVSKSMEVNLNSRRKKGGMALRLPLDMLRVEG
jgi:hypothetical protein